MRTTRTSGRTTMGMVLAVLFSIIAASLVGCGNYKDGDYSWQLEDWNSGGDIGRLLRGVEKPPAKGGPVAPGVVLAQVQYLEVAGRPGYWSDGQLALASGSRHLFMHEEQSGISGMSGSMALLVEGFRNNVPVTMTATAGFPGWHNTVFTNAELPAGVYRFRAVKVGVNGTIVAEALQTYEFYFSDDGNFYEDGTELLSGVPGTTGDIYAVRRGADGTLFIRTKGARVQVVGSWDNGRPTILEKTDINGWASFMPADVSGNPTSGVHRAFLIKLNSDGSAQPFDVSQSKFSSEITVTGSTVTKKGLVFFLDNNVMYGNVTSAPTLVSLRTSPSKASVPVGETVTLTDVVGVFSNGWRASVKLSSALAGNTSNAPAVSKVSALVYKGDAPGVSQITVSLQGVTSSPATELTAFESFLELTAQPPQVASSGKGQLTVLLHKRGEPTRDITRGLSTTYVSEKPGVLAVTADGSYIGGAEGNATVNVTDTMTNTEGKITVSVQPKPLLSEIRLPKTTIAAGERMQLELIVIAQGASGAANKASEAKWSAENTAVASVVATSGEITGLAGGGKTKINALYLGILVTSSELTVTPAVAVPTVTSIAASSNVMTVVNTASPVDVTLTSTLSDSTMRPSQNVTAVITPANAPLTVTITGNVARLAPVANRSGSGTVVFTESGKSVSVSYNETAVLATLSPTAQALQVGASVTLASIPGIMNDSLNTGGAAAVTIPINKVTVGTSSNPAVATMSAAGVVNALSAGTATIPLTSVDVPTVTANLTVTVTVISPSSLTVTLDTGAFFNTGSPSLRGIDVIANFPSGATSNVSGIATISSSNPAIFDVSSVVVGKPGNKAGEVVVTATLNGLIGVGTFTSRLGAVGDSELTGPVRAGFERPSLFFSWIHFYIAEGAMPGAKNKMKIHIWNPATNAVTVLPLDKVVTGTNGAAWRMAMKDVPNTGPTTLVVQVFNGDDMASATDWLNRNSSAFFSSGSQGQGLVFTIDPNAGTIVKGQMP